MEQMDPATFTPDDSPLTVADVMSSPIYQDLVTPMLSEGDPAFDFELPRLDRPEEVVRLSTFAGERPVALIFGSYTWPPFRRQLGALHDLYEYHGDRVAFFIVYIKEAHPEDGWVVTHNREEGIAVVDPSSGDERAEVANTCVVRSAIRIPVVVDSMDNVVASAYGGWPDRLYLVGRDGRIAFQGEMGPFGFQPEVLKTAVEEELRAIGEHA